jgi:hypothetical protein
MQTEPLLEQLDWFFTSPNWTLRFPNTEVLPMVKITSDHLPCRIVISTKIPRSTIFRFENFWVEHEEFLDIVLDSWRSMRANENSARNMSSKLKKLRASLKSWSKNLSNLSLLISNCNTTILFLDQLEDTRGLFNTEVNSRIIIKAHLQTLLHYKNLYWRKRLTNNRIKFGAECTKSFHAMATISHIKNIITQLLNEDGV